MLNIHSTKTVSSLVVYLTFDDFRCDDEFGYWLYWHYRCFSLLACVIVLFVCFNSCHSCHSVRYMTCWNKRLLTYLQSGRGSEQGTVNCSIQPAGSRTDQIKFSIIIQSLVHWTLILLLLFRFAFLFFSFNSYDTIEEFNVDSKVKYSALSSTRSQKKKLKQTKASAFLIQHKTVLTDLFIPSAIFVYFS